MDKTHLESAVCHMVKESDALGRTIMFGKLYQLKVATMAGAPLKAEVYCVTELHGHSLKLPEVKGIITFTSFSKELVPLHVLCCCCLGGWVG